ncbi:Putative cytosolic protein [Mammaliicoccus lentus]|nr:Putative cytosolic protein [Mammaliicoccus lentus]
MKSGDKMLSKEKIERINELANKKKTSGLSEQEAKEQTKLRAEYLQAFRGNFKDTIESTKVIDPEGKDVTPEKLKEIQKKNNIRN